MARLKESSHLLSIVRPGFSLYDATRLVGSASPQSRDVKGVSDDSRFSWIQGPKELLVWMAHSPSESVSSDMLDWYVDTLFSVYVYDVVDHIGQSTIRMKKCAPGKDCDGLRRM